MFPGNTDYGEQIDHFEMFEPHIHYHVRMKEKDNHYTAFATLASTGNGFSHYFDHEPNREEVLEWFNQDERLADWRV